MLRYVVAAMAAVGFASFTVAEAQTRERIGYGRLFTNDFIGDGEDRWRTGSISSSRVWGPEWTGVLPQDFGDIIEMRLQGQIIAPDDLSIPAATDRPYAGILSVGAHTHFAKAGYEFAVGGDLVLTGPSTGLDGFQDTLHDFLDVTGPSSQVRAAQIGDGLHPTIVAEVGRQFSFGDTHLRPFAELRAGAETLARAGFDLSFGSIGQAELLVREEVTGHRYRTVYAPAGGFTFVLGADTAYVEDSIYLPASAGVQASERRDRVRAGLHWQSGETSGFYGLTWLSEEFDAQPNGQVLGSVRFKFLF